MEIEVKVLDIDPQDVRARILAIGSIFLGREFQQNYMYDYPDRRLYEQQDGSYVRLRRRRFSSDPSFLQAGATSGEVLDEVLLTFKRTVSREKYKIADETETTVGDLEQMDRFLTLMGLQQVRVDEKLRESYQLGRVRFEIDEWAGLPPYLELEAASEADVSEALELLGYTLADSTTQNLREVLAMYNVDSECLRFEDFGRNIEF